MSGKLVIISGPSGAGKSTIVKQLLKNDILNLAFSISACSRKMRKDEEEGKDYYFLSVDSFKSKIEEYEFLEWEEVYPNQYYGTLKAEVERLRSANKNVIFDLDVMGSINIKQQDKKNTIAIFINPPSFEALEKRLKYRNTDSLENINKRLRKAKMELSYASKFDHVLLNDNLKTVIEQAEQLIKVFLQS